jgi:hypothetical protein
LIYSGQELFSYKYDNRQISFKSLSLDGGTGLSHVFSLDKSEKKDDSATFESEGNYGN